MKEYFSHDHNARHDRKVVALISKYKSAGYGIFWATNEMMHEEDGELEFDEITFGAIAKHLNEDESFIKEVITACINTFKLYILSGEKLTSNRVNRNITGSEQRKLAKSEKAANSGRLGGIKSGESRRSKQTLEANEATLEADGSNEAKGKERKGEKGEKGEKGKESIESKETGIPENFSLTKIYNKKFSELNGVFTSLTEVGFLNWKKFVDLIIKKNYCEIFNCKFINPQDFEKIDFPESKWEETVKLLLSTGIEEKHNLFFRIPQFVKYGTKGTNGSSSSNGAAISGTSVIPTDKKYSGRL